MLSEHVCAVNYQCFSPSTGANAVMPPLLCNSLPSNLWSTLHSSDNSEMWVYNGKTKQSKSFLGAVLEADSSQEEFSLRGDNLILSAGM